MSYHFLKWEKGQRLSSVSSTNEWIKNPEVPVGSWVIADEQTQGKGRGQHTWQTLGDEFLIFSGKIQFPQTDIQLQLVSIFVAAGLLKALQKNFPKVSTDLSIKWPNDIYREDKKVAGILIESEIQSGICTLVIGIGVNVFGQNVPNEWKTKAAFVSDNLPMEGELETLTKDLIEQLNHYFIKMIDPSTILQELIWVENHSYLKDKAIETLWDSKIVRGKVLGIDEFGFLIIMTEKGEKIELMDTSPEFRVI
ncbi:biotin--[acetyl-CoA-carboxylase] ligase [Leptospira ryugenii]|uniref:biotin--[biotin carboxyl-carrier protein] ligase n=1 Tax=Leptospira ryugenii TaxID=1917863 RepID=A0A2P2E3U5_9LEPT|nr:biotin--[acetyl-CoA-carboxylase] ligase [Leptospira ryugenii]GBF51506.1 biotin--[acetyl-CoA-carboxylase] ligase [Leptospira ryugenii]